MTECAGHNDKDCRKNLSERMDKNFIGKPGAVGRWLIGGICSVLLLMSAFVFGFAIRYVQAQGEKIYTIDKTQSKMADGFKNLSEAMKKIIDITEKLDEATIRNQEKIESDAKHNKEIADKLEKRLDRIHDRQP